MTVESYDSFEEMQAALGRQIEAAKARIKPFQRVLADGKEHWFLRVVQYDEPYLLVGRIFDLDQLHRDNVAKYGAQAEPGELDYEHQHRVAGLDRGFVFTEVFSQLEPRGELGDTHISTMWEITQGQFDRFLELGYDIPAVMADPTLRSCVIHWVMQVGQ